MERRLTRHIFTSFLTADTFVRPAKAALLDMQRITRVLRVRYPPSPSSCPFTGRSYAPNCYGLQARRLAMGAVELSSGEVRFRFDAGTNEIAEVGTGPVQCAVGWAGWMAWWGVV